MKTSLTIVVVAIIFIFGVWKTLPIKLGADYKLKLKNKPSDVFLKNINLDDGDYEIYLNIKGKGEFWIDDKTAIINNKDNIIIDKSWVNYLPGEGNRGYGAALYRNRQLVKSIYGGVFNVFKYGDILQSAEPFDEVMERISIYETKKDLLKRNIDALETNENIFGLQKPVFNDVERPYYYHVKFPTVIVPALLEDNQGFKNNTNYAHPVVTDRFYAEALGKNIYESIKQKTKTLEKCKLGNSRNASAHGASQHGMYIIDKATGVEIENKENRLIYIRELKLEKYGVSFHCEDSQALKQLEKFDFKPFIKAETYNHQALTDIIIEKLKTSEKSLGIKDVAINGFQEKMIVESGFYEDKYSLWYLKKK